MIPIEWIDFWRYYYSLAGFYFRDIDNQQYNCLYNRPHLVMGGRYTDRYPPRMMLTRHQQLTCLHLCNCNHQFSFSVVKVYKRKITKTYHNDTTTAMMMMILFTVTTINNNTVSHCAACHCWTLRNARLLNNVFISQERDYDRSFAMCVKRWFISRHQVNEDCCTLTP